MAALEHPLAPTARETRPPIPLPRTLDEMLTLAEIVMKSDLALGHRTKESVVIALQLGAELGFTPMARLRTRGAHPRPTHRPPRSRQARSRPRPRG